MAERETKSTTESDMARDDKHDHYAELMVKLLMLGNAGGVASTIGLIGVFLGTRQPASIPVELYNILQWFGLGLVGGLLVVVGAMVGVPVEIREEHSFRGRMLRALDKVRGLGFLISTAGYSTALGCLIYGSQTGMTFLKTLIATSP